jgi:hypothetical protein
MRGKMIPGSRASSEHPTRQNRDCAPRGIRTPNRQIRRLVVYVHTVSLSLDPPKHRELDGFSAGQRAI